MKKARTVLFSTLVLAFTLLISSVAFAETRITIFHTNDLHGRLVRSGEFAMNANSIGLELIASIVAAEEHSLLLDAGDTIHGTNFVGLDRGTNAIELMSQVGFDVMVPGNHDFNFGTDRLIELAGLADFEIITSNVYRDGAPILGNEPLILEVNGLQIGIFGLTTESTPTVTHPNNVAGVSFIDPIEVSQRIVAELQAQGVDMIIALTHLGVNSPTTTSVQLAEAVDGIDLIVDGHSHTELPEGMWVNDTLIVQAFEHGLRLGRVDVVIDDEGNITMEASLIDAAYATENFEASEEILEVIAAMKDALGETLNVVVGYSDAEMGGDRRDVRTREMPLGNLIADALAWAADAPLAMTNSGGIRADLIAGDLTLGDVISVLPFSNFTVVVEVTPAILFEALENAVYRWPIDDGRFAQVSGFDFVFNGYAEPGARVKTVTVNGEYLDRNDTETVFELAINNFMHSGGDSYSMFVNLPTVREAGMPSEVLIAFISEHELAGRDYEGRIVQIGREGDAAEEEAEEPGEELPPVIAIEDPIAQISRIPTIEIDGVKFVWFRQAAEAYGLAGNLTWVEETQQIILVSAERGADFILSDVGGFIQNDRAYVPFDFAFSIFEG